MQRNILKGGLCAALLFTSACSGGGSSNPTYTRVTDTSASPLTVATISNDGLATVAKGDSTFDPAAGTIPALNGTGTAAVATTGLTDGLSYVAEVPASTAAGDVRLIAVQTNPAHMPTAGTMTYNGIGNATVFDTGTATTYQGQMNAQIVARLDGGTPSVDVTLTGNPGSVMVAQTGVSAGSYTLTGTEFLTLTGATISGSGFSGGTAASARGFGGSGELLAGTVTQDSQGVFAGPQAAEVAGGAVAEGSSNGAFSMTFVGSR